MPNNANESTDKAFAKKSGPKQTDLAEGELETVEESIRIHEQKGDEQSGEPESKKKE